MFCVESLRTEENDSGVADGGTNDCPEGSDIVFEVLDWLPLDIEAVKGRKGVDKDEGVVEIATSGASKGRRCNGEGDILLWETHEALKLILFKERSQGGI